MSADEVETSWRLGFALSVPYIAAGHNRFTLVAFCELRLRVNHVLAKRKVTNKVIANLSLKTLNVRRESLAFSQSFFPSLVCRDVSIHRV